MIRTLRDGTQGVQVNHSAEDKIKVAHRLDDMGIALYRGRMAWIKPKDAGLFIWPDQFHLKNAKLTAFGSTRRFGVTPENDPSIQAILEAETPAVTVFGKTWDLHATEILGVTLEQNLEMIEDTVRYLKNKGREVIYDAEHFFDGYKNNLSTP
jgi:2-isopropylmalate synthase